MKYPYVYNGLQWFLTKFRYKVCSNSKKQLSRLTATTKHDLCSAVLTSEIHENLFKCIQRANYIKSKCLYAWNVEVSIVVIYSPFRLSLCFAFVYMPQNLHFTSTVNRSNGISIKLHLPSRCLNSKFLPYFSKS